MLSKNSIITEINNEVINFIGYSRNDLIGKSLTEISCMLRITSQINLENIKNDYSCYIFTKSYEVREVDISCRVLEYQNERIYYFKEKINSRIEEKFLFAEHLYVDNKIGVAIRSFPDLILLRDNQKYLIFLDAPYNKKENSIGRKQKEIITGY